MSEWPGQEWITGWVEAWGDRMTQFAFSLVKDPMMAQDVVQEAFLRLYRWHQKHPAQDVEVGWLYTVTRNLSYDALRAKQRRPIVLEAVEEIERLSDHPGAIQNQAKALESSVLEVLENLDAVDRECLTLFYYADFSTKEIAQRLHLSDGSVRTRLYRARLRFKELWEERS